MGVSILNGQAVNILGDRSYCIPDTDWAQPVLEGDCTSWQMDLSEADNVELFTNASLDYTSGVACPTDWTCDGLAFATTSSQAQLLPTGQISQAITVEDGKYYRVCVDISELTGNQALCILTDTAVVETVNCTNETGYFCAYFYGVGTSDTIYFAATGNQGFIILESVSLKEISLPTITLETCEGDTVAASFDLEIFKERAQAKLCWEGLDNGCYKICINPIEITSFNILDGANNILTNGGRRLITNSNAAITWIP